MENKKIKNATPLEYNGIHFKSKLEVAIYKTFVEAGLNPVYEQETIVLMQGFRPTVPIYMRNKKTRNLELNQKKIIDWKYTPDLVVTYNNIKYYIEIKGRGNDLLPYKRKMFFKFLESVSNTVYMEIYTKREALQAIQIIKSYGRDNETDKGVT